MTGDGTRDEASGPNGRRSAAAAGSSAPGAVAPAAGAELAGASAARAGSAGDGSDVPTRPTSSASTAVVTIPQTTRIGKP